MHRKYWEVKNCGSPTKLNLHIHNDLYQELLKEKVEAGGINSNLDKETELLIGFVIKSDRR